MDQFFDTGFRGHRAPRVGDAGRRRADAVVHLRSSSSRDQFRSVLDQGIRPVEWIFEIDLRHHALILRLRRGWQRRLRHQTLEGHFRGHSIVPVENERLGNLLLQQRTQIGVGRLGTPLALIRSAKTENEAKGPVVDPTLLVYPP